MKGTVSLKKCIKREKLRQIDDLADRAEIPARKGNMRDLYRTAAEITQRGRAWNSSRIPVMDTDGKLLVTTEAQMRRWSEHFCSLLNNDEENEHVRNSPEDPYVDLIEVLTQIHQTSAKS